MMKPTSRNRQPVFDKFQEAGFIEAGHNKWKVARWALALLFGGFRQGQGTLENPQTGRFCCLGVLCKISGAERETTSDYTGAKIVHYDGNSALFGPGKYLGGSATNWDWDNYPDFAYANDKRGAKFHEIAFFLLGTLLPWKHS